MTTGSATVSLLIDAGVSIEDVADLLGDDPATVLRHYRHKIGPVADAAPHIKLSSAAESRTLSTAVGTSQKCVSVIRWMDQ